MADANLPEVTLEHGGIEVEIGPESKLGEQALAPAEPQKTPEKPLEQPAIGVEALQNQIKALEGREAAALRDRANLEKRARDQAHELTRAQEDNAKARGEIVDARRTTIDTQIVAAQAEADVARRDYQLALEGGDFSKASEANWRLNKAAAQVALLDEKKAVFAETAQRPHEGAVRQQQAQPTNDADTYIETKSPRTQAWLREHPECVTDPRMNNKTVGAHYEALAEGYAPDTEGYFGFIDRRLGYAGQIAEPNEQAELNEAPPQRKAAQRAQPPAAPVSRDPPRSERSPGRMYLSRGEQEVAEALGITPSEYARRKQAMEKQGFYHT